MNKTILCDTCVLIDFVNGRSEQINQLNANNIALFINPVIELELLQGARNKAELLRLEKINGQFYNVEMPSEVINVAR